MSMTATSTLCVLSGVLAALTLSTNLAAAETLHVHTVTPQVHVQTGTGSHGSGGGTGKVDFDTASPNLFSKTTGNNGFADKSSPKLFMRKAGGSNMHYDNNNAPQLCCTGEH